jgi:transcription elongation factor Elf1
MAGADAHVVRFQCPNCGYDLEHTVGLLKAQRRLVCGGCQVGVNFDTAKLAQAAETLHAALPSGPNEITIKFYR